MTAAEAVAALDREEVQAAMRAAYAEAAGSEVMALTQLTDDPTGLAKVGLIFQEGASPYGTFRAVPEGALYPKRRLRPWRLRTDLLESARQMGAERRASVEEDRESGEQDLVVREAWPVLLEVNGATVKVSEMYAVENSRK